MIVPKCLKQHKIKHKIKGFTWELETEGLGVSLKTWDGAVALGPVSPGGQNNTPRHGWFRQKRIFSQFWSPDVREQGVGRLAPLGPERGSAPGLPPRLPPSESTWLLSHACARPRPHFTLMTSLLRDLPTETSLQESFCSKYWGSGLQQMNLGGQFNS